MKRFLRTVAAATLLLLALFVIPKAFGWRTATVTSVSTFYPATVASSAGGSSNEPLLWCEQASSTETSTASLKIAQNLSNGTRSYFRCKNNWGSAANFQITLQSFSGGDLFTVTTSPAVQLLAGEMKCVPAQFTTSNKDSTGTALYTVTVSATDLTATLQFSGTVTFTGQGNASVQCS